MRNRVLSAVAILLPIEWRRSVTARDRLGAVMSHKSADSSQKPEAQSPM